MNYDELDTNLTRGSIGGARAVLEQLQHNDSFDMEQRAALLHAEAILYDVMREEQLNPEPSEPQVIPIDGDAIESEEAAGAIARFAHGSDYE